MSRDEKKIITDEEKIMQLFKSHYIYIVEWSCRAKLKNGQHHHEKLKFDVGLTCLEFSLEGTLNVFFVFFD